MEEIYQHYKKLIREAIYYGDTCMIVSSNDFDIPLENYLQILLQIQNDGYKVKPIKIFFTTNYYKISWEVPCQTLLFC